MKHITANLLSEIRTLRCAAQFRFLFLLLCAFTFKELCAKKIHRLLSVLLLTAFALATDNNIRRKMSNTNGALGLIDMLSTGAATAKCIDAKFFRRNIYFLCLGDFWKNFHECKARLPQIFCVKRGEANQTVRSACL